MRLDVPGLNWTPAGKEEEELENPPMKRIYTVGHSTRTAEELLAMLRAFEIDVLADIRTVPRSRTNPQSNSDTFARTLRRAKIEYVHLARLGGLRKARADSTNTAWRNKSFRGYADYMQTEEFEEGIGELLALANERSVAIMCSEATPWRCHRSLVADALTARELGVEHIMSATKANPHRPTPFAHVEGQHVTYPGGDDLP